MIDGNISMEEDTELRDLVVQTLESNGVLAKVRAELRASVFLALEEQESVVNPEPLLSKTVKQYLANSEGKLLFSLVREFLEYFGLDYTISVYDPETYSGKDYNYIGRNKLCEKLGINTTEPLLGELLKATLNGVLNNSEKIDETNDSRLNKTSETSTNFNATFEVSVPKIDHKDITTTTTTITNDDDSSDKADDISDFSREMPINVTITDKKNSEKIENTSIKNCKLRDCTNIKSVIDTDNNKRSNNNLITEENDNKLHTAATTCSNEMTKIVDNKLQLSNKNEHLIKFDESTEYFNDDKSKKLMNDVDFENTNNAQLNNQNDFVKTDGKNLNICMKKNDSTLLGDLPPIVTKNNSIFSDLPPLNGKKTDINDLKELMDIGLTGDGVDNYDEDFASSASGSTNEQSPVKDTNKIIDKPEKERNKNEEKIINSARSEEISDDIEEVLSENVSSLEGASGAKSLSNVSMGITSQRVEEV